MQCLLYEAVKPTNGAKLLSIF